MRRSTPTSAQARARVEEVVDRATVHAVCPVCGADDEPLDDCLGCSGRTVPPAVLVDAMFLELREWEKWDRKRDRFHGTSVTGMLCRVLQTGILGTGNSGTKGAASGARSEDVVVVEIDAGPEPIAPTRMEALKGRERDRTLALDLRYDDCISHSVEHVETVDLGALAEWIWQRMGQPRELNTAKRSLRGLSWPLFVGLHHGPAERRDSWVKKIDEKDQRPVLNGATEVGQALLERLAVEWFKGGDR